MWVRDRHLSERGRPLLLTGSKNSFGWAHSKAVPTCSAGRQAKFHPQTTHWRNVQCQAATAEVDEFLHDRQTQAAARDRQIQPRTACHHPIAPVGINTRAVVLDKKQPHLRLACINRAVRASSRPQDRITRSAWFERKHRQTSPAAWHLASAHAERRDGVPAPAQDLDHDKD